MTEKCCNYGMKYFLFQMGRLKTCTVFSIIFAVLGFPLIYVTYAMAESSTDFKDELIVPLAALGVICILGTCAMSYITPILAHRYLFTKTNADNILSLPLTANQRFIADIAATYVSFALPYLASCGISVILHLIFGLREGTYITEYGFKGFLLLLMFSSLNIAVMTCCGRLVEAILYPLCLNIVLPLITIFSAYISLNNCRGITDEFNEVFTLPFVLMWPFGSLMGVFYMHSNALHLYALVMTAVSLAAAFLGVKKRRAENIGKPFVFRYSYFIVSALVSLALIVLYTAALEVETISENHTTIIVLAIILFILMLIMEVINYKKIKSILSFLIRYGGILAGGLLLCWGLSVSNGFGAANLIPSTALIESVDIRGYYYPYDESSTSRRITATTKDTIELIREEHKRIIDTTETEDGASHSNFYITYNLKTGEYISREYYFNTADSAGEGFWDEMYASPDFRVQGLQDLEGSSYFSEIDEITIRLTNQHSSKNYINFRVTDLEPITEALEKDLLADSNYGRHADKAIGVLQIGYMEQDLLGEQAYAISYPDQYFDGFHGTHMFTIYESYENTLALLKQHGDIPTVEEAVEDSAKNCEVFMVYRIKKPTTDYPFTTGNMHNIENSSAVFITAEEFKELSGAHIEYVPSNYNDEYVYFATRGIWNQLGFNDNFYNYVAGIEDAGMSFDNYDFLQDDNIYYEDNYFDTALHESLNSRCAQLFEERICYVAEY